MMSLHLLALEFRFVIALMTFKAVRTCFLHDGASGCPGIRRRQWIGIKAAWSKKYSTYQAANLVWVPIDQNRKMQEMHSSAALKHRLVAILSAEGVVLVAGEEEDFDASDARPSWVHRIRNGRYIMIRKRR